MNMSQHANAHSPASTQLDPRQIAMLRVLRKGTLLPQLLCTYREQVIEQVHALRVALDCADHATARLVSHTLKSASFSVGAKQVGELCALIERQAINEDGAHSARMMVELQSCLDALLPEIDGYLTP